MSSDWRVKATGFISAQVWSLHKALGTVYSSLIPTGVSQAYVVPIKLILYSSSRNRSRIWKRWKSSLKDQLACASIHKDFFFFVKANSTTTLSGWDNTCAMIRLLSEFPFTRYNTFWPSVAIHHTKQTKWQLYIVIEQYTGNIGYNNSIIYITFSWILLLNRSRIRRLINLLE